jgi:protein gp37
MAQGSRIEWTGSTWNPIVGCTKVSAGCKSCYAERMAKRLAAMARADRAAGRDPGRKGNYVHVVDDRGHWNETVFKDYRALEDPLHWRSPRVVFVNSMSDLFHEDMPLHFIRAVFAVMNRCPQHTFQVLTKRPHLAAEYSGELCWTENIWMGTTVENATVTHRVQSLRRTGAHIKFLSLEPLLGAIPRLPLSGIDWVIVGGESGPGARPMRAEWVRYIRDRCVAHEVPFFFKQWGGVNKKRNGRRLDGGMWDGMPNSCTGGLTYAAACGT